MQNDIQFTGERFVPGIAGEIAHEHVHRYAFARGLVAGRRVLDVACGEGYGSAILAEAATAVVGVDVDVATIAHARATYRNRTNLEFCVGSAAALPLRDASFDAIVSFETIEHLPAHAQSLMLAEFDRLLAPSGILVLSSPNRPEYSEVRNYRNPFHLHELDRDELAGLLDPSFPARRWYAQRRYFGSALWAIDRGDGYEALTGNSEEVRQARTPQALYYVVVAAGVPAALPAQHPALSIYSDSDEAQWRSIEAQAREVLRLDALLKERDGAVDRQTAHIRHLEELLAYHGRIVAERDAQLAEAGTAHDEALKRLAAKTDENARTTTALQQCEALLDAQRKDLEAAIAAQERIIAYRQSGRWWLQLPWLRLRGLWQRAQKL